MPALTSTRNSYPSKNSCPPRTDIHILTNLPWDCAGRWGGELISMCALPFFSSHDNPPRAHIHARTHIHIPPHISWYWLENSYPYLHSSFSSYLLRSCIHLRTDIRPFLEPTENLYPQCAMCAIGYWSIKVELSKPPKSSFVWTIRPYGRWHFILTRNKNLI